MVAKLYYKITVNYIDELFYILGDGKHVKTPAKNDLFTIDKKLADEICHEWQILSLPITPEKLPMTGIRFAVIDRISTHRDIIIEQIVDRLAHDTLRFFVPSHNSSLRSLYHRQEEVWAKIIAWFNHRFDMKITIISGDDQQFSVNSHDYDSDYIKNILHGYDDDHLALINQYSALSNSLILAMATIDQTCELVKNSRDIVDIHAMERLFQYEEWGIDEEAQKALDFEYTQFADLWHYQLLLSSHQ